MDANAAGAAPLPPHVDPRRVVIDVYEPGAEANDDDFSKSRNWIMKDPAKPWMLVFASNDPHAPWDRGAPGMFDPAKITLPWYLHDNADTRQNFANYYAEILKLDWQVGEMLKVLESTGQADNTLVLFVSEQGNSFPMGGKWTLYDNGIRAAAIARAIAIGVSKFSPIWIGVSSASATRAHPA